MVHGCLELAWLSTFVYQLLPLASVPAISSKVAGLVSPLSVVAAFGCHASITVNHTLDTLKTGDFTHGSGQEYVPTVTSLRLFWAAQSMSQGTRTLTVES